MYQLLSKLTLFTATTQALDSNIVIIEKNTLKNMVKNVTWVAPQAVNHLFLAQVETFFSFFIA